MAGLLEQGMSQPQGGPPPQAQPGQPPQQAPQGQSGGDPRVDMDPEQGPQQRQVIVDSMLDLLYGEMLQDVRDILAQHGDNPEQGIARVLAQLLTMTWKTMAAEGKSIPPGVLVQAGMVLSQAIGEMAIRLRLIPEEDSDTIEAAFMIAMGEFGKATAEQMQPEQRQRYAQLIEAIQQGREMAIGGQQPPQEQPPQGARQPEPQQGGM